MARVEVIAAGDSPDAITPAMRTSLEAAMAQQAGVAPSLVSLRIVQASLLLIFEIATQTRAASLSLATQLEAAMPTPAAAQAIVNAAGVGAVTVVSAPAVTSVVSTVLMPAPPSAPSPSPPQAAAPDAAPNQEAPPPPRSPALVVVDDNLESEGAGLVTVLTIAIPVVAVLLLGGAAVAFLVCRNHAKRRASRGSAPQFSAGPMILTRASDVVEIDLG